MNERIPGAIFNFQKALVQATEVKIVYQDIDSLETLDCRLDDMVSINGTVIIRHRLSIALRYLVDHNVGDL